MKKKIFICIISLFSLGVSAQQLPDYSQYMYNRFVLNPAIAGSEINFIPVTMTLRNQWAGIEQSPKTQTLGVHGPVVGKNMGIGGYLFNHTTGSMRLTGLEIAYAYHLKVNKTSKLSLGLSGIMYQYVLDKSKLFPDNPSDNLLQGGVEKSITPDAKFGIYYYHAQYFASVSVAHLIQSKIKSSDNINTGLSYLSRHYYLMGGYDFKINDNVSVKPSFLLSTIGSGISQSDISMNFYYKENWVGVSYRHKNAVSALLGFNYKAFQIGYSYDFALTDLGRYSSGSHEIIAGYKIRTSTKHEEIEKEIEQKEIVIKGRKTNARIKNVDFELINENIIITYDIIKYKPDEKFYVRVNVYSALENKINAQSLTGDVNNNISGGNHKKIVWDLKKDNINLDNDIYIVVSAKPQ